MDSVAGPGNFNIQSEEAGAMQDPDSTSVLPAASQKISPGGGGDLNQNTASPPIVMLLEHTLYASMEEVEALAMETIVSSQVPLISSRYTKTVVGNAVKDCRKINDIQSRLLALTLLTDQEVSGVVSNIVDIFQLSTNGGKIKALEQLGRAWAETFAEINLLHRASTLSLRKPSKEVMTAVLGFLRRQKALLGVLEDKAFGQSLFGKMNLQNNADYCFWNYSLETIDGRKKLPVNSWLKKPWLKVGTSDKSPIPAPSQSKPSTSISTSPLSRFISSFLSPRHPLPSAEPEPEPELVVPGVVEGPKPGLENPRDKIESSYGKISVLPLGEELVICKFCNSYIVASKIDVHTR